MVATTLHSVATGNLLPASVRIICVDNNTDTITKLMDRGTRQAFGLVTDCQFFLKELAARLPSAITVKPLQLQPPGGFCVPKLTVEGYGTCRGAGRQATGARDRAGRRRRHPARLRRQRAVHDVPCGVHRRRAGDAPPSPSASGWRPRADWRPPLVPDPVRPRHDRSRDQPSRGQWPAGCGWSSRPKRAVVPAHREWRRVGARQKHLFTTAQTVPGLLRHPACTRSRHRLFPPSERPT